MSQQITEPQTPAPASSPAVEDAGALWDAMLAGQQQQAQPAPQLASPRQEVHIDLEGAPSVIDGIGDFIDRAFAGPQAAVNEVMDLSYSTGKFVKDVAEKGWSEAKFTEENAPLRFTPPEFESTGGKIMKDVTQFATGFALTGQAMKAGKVLQGASEFARSAMQGGLSDFFTLDAHQERFSNLLLEFPVLQKVANTLAATNKDDSLPVGRAKNMLEGFGLGAIAEGFIKGCKSLLALRGAKSVDEAVKALDEINAAPMEAPTSQASQAAADLAGASAEPGARGYKADAIKPADQIKEIIDSAANETEAFSKITDSANLQRNIWDTPQGSHVMRQIGDALADNTLKSAGKEGRAKILADVKDELADFGMDVTEMLAEAGGNVDALHGITRRLLSNRAVLHQMTTESGRLAQKVNLGTASAIDRYRLDLLTENMQQMHLAVADTRTEIARALSSLNQVVDNKTARGLVGEGDDFLAKFLNTPDITEEDAIKGLAQRGRDSKQIERLANDIIMAEGNPAAVGRILNSNKPGSWWGVFTEYRMHNLLSSPFTWAFNGLNNTLKIAAMPAERMIGGVLTGDMQSIQSGMRTYVGLTKFMGESFDMAWKAMKLNKNVLDSKNGIMETPTRQMTYENIANLLLRGQPEGATLNPLQEYLAWGIHGLGKVSDFSSRIMVGTDELFKQLYFRADLYSKLYDEAVSLKGLKDSGQISSYVETKMRDAFKPDGAVAAGELTADSLFKAQRATWTQSLEQGTFFNSVQALVSRHPAMRLIIPFVKTPSNIILDLAAHAPTAPLGKKFRAAWAQGGEARAEALGQVALGTFTMSIAASLAHQGAITGSAPKNPKLRAALEATGWQPYSIKIGDKYYSYRRVDPVGMFMGMMADAVAVLTERDDLTELERKDIIMGLTATAINNVMSKTYMQGLMEFVNVFGDPERYLDAFAGRQAATFVPSAGLLRTIRQQVDPHMRDMGDGLENSFDYVKNTIPAMSQDLPARRSWVTGEFMDYRLTGKHSDSIVLNEMQRLGKGVVGAPAKALDGVKLSSAQYSRLCELHGTVRIGGKTMHQALEKLIKSPGYDLERQRYGDAPEGLNKSRRGEAVDRVIDQYRRRAVSELRREDRALNKTLADKKRMDAAAAAGALRKDNQTEMLQRLIR